MAAREPFKSCPCPQDHASSIQLMFELSHFCQGRKLLRMSAAIRHASNTCNFCVVETWKRNGYAQPGLPGLNTAADAVCGFFLKSVRCKLVDDSISKLKATLEAISSFGRAIVNITVITASSRGHSGNSKFTKFRGFGQSATADPDSKLGLNCQFCCQGHCC